jgi:hypothetical protein
MEDKKESGSAIPILKWSGKGGSGISVMHHADENGKLSPWSGEQLAEELTNHAKMGNSVSFAAIHNGQMVGDAKPAAKKAAAKPAAKPAAKKDAAKPAAKPVAKPAAKGAKSVIATKAAAGVAKAKGTAKPGRK